MKEILSSHDVSAVVNELQKYIGTRINNVYDDTNTSKYCIPLDYKLDKINKKIFLILESAKKVYLVDEFTNIRKMPGGFCGRLRKTIKNKRRKRN
jgi:predicted ribosome quality control (RQC) complex YloA/Tae2 family protein